jgi:4'-phosphopantetheinyl transferase
VRTLAPRPWPEDPVPELPAGAAHVWVVRLDDEQAAGRRPVRDVLSPAERDRAGRFADEGLTRRWSRTRAALRELLAAYAGADPAALAIEPAPCVHCGEPHGKPILAGAEGEWLRFNVSHSAGLALVAVANGREVGVDVEAAREGRRFEGIAQRYFDPTEAAAIGGLEGPERDAAFYRLWARKEAYLKATAEGIMTGTLAAVDARNLDEREGWEFADLQLGDDYAGALAVAPPGFRPRAPAGGGRRSR